MSDIVPLPIDQTLLQQQLGQVQMESSGDKKFLCQTCGHSFTRKHNLVSHELIHTKEKPHSCKVCGSKFRRLHDLKRHEKLHTGEKPYECSKCGRKFARCDALVRHNNSQSGCILGGPVMDGEEMVAVPDSRKHKERKSYETNQWKINSGTIQQLPSITNLTGNSQSQEDSVTINTLLKQQEEQRRQMERKKTLEQPLHLVEVAEPSDMYSYAKLLERRIAMLEQKVQVLESK